MPTGLFTLDLRDQAITNPKIADATIDLTTKVTGLLPDANIFSATTWNAKQAALSGTGFVKISGSTISYDNSTYLTSSTAGSTYVPYIGALTNLDMGSNTITTTGIIYGGDGVFNNSINAPVLHETSTGVYFVVSAGGPSGGPLRYRTAAEMAADIGVGGYIPYTGATSNVDLGVYNLRATSLISGYTTTATAAGTTTLTVSSTQQQFFTGTNTQTIVLPVTSTLVLGHQFVITNKSTSSIVVNSSGGNGIASTFAGWCSVYTCILTSGTTAASWNVIHTPLLANAQNGFVPYSGATTSVNIGTNSFTSGDLLISSNIGGLTTLKMRNQADLNNFVSIILTDNGSTSPYEYLTFRFKQMAFGGGPTIDTLVLDGSGKSLFNYAGIVMQDSTAQLLNIITAGTMTTPWTWTYPDNPGTNDGDVLATDASGTTRWQVSTHTLGSTLIALDSTTTTIAGLTSVTSTTFVGALTGHASLDLALTGGTMSGAINMGGQNITNGGTAAFTTGTFSGNVTIGSGTITNPVGYSRVISVGGSDGAIELIAGSNHYSVGNVGGNLIFSDGATERMRINTSGNLVAVGSVTGGAASFTTGTFSGTINSIVTSNAVSTANSATTGSVYSQIANTGGNTIWGTEGSSAGTRATGTLAYAGLFGTFGNVAAQIITNGIVRQTISGAGAVTFTSTVTVGSGGFITTGTTSGAVTIKSATGTWTMTLPTSGGSNGYYLQTNGSGLTSWQPVAASGISADSGTDSYIPVITSGGTLLEASSLYKAATNLMIFRGSGSSSITTLNPFGWGSSNTNIFVFSTAASGNPYRSIIEFQNNGSYSGSLFCDSFASMNIDSASDFYVNTATLCKLQSATQIQFNAPSTLVLNDLDVWGALSKGSGSFKIDHPLLSMSTTHHLVHSFIEGPKADLIYRGTIQLVNGKATVNIDRAATMTEGTFEALCGDVQCYTTNEDTWDNVKGSVKGNILTIVSQNTDSTATISWIVIGERKDPHMLNTNWTDSDGHVIVEPLKKKI